MHRRLVIAGDLSTRCARVSSRGDSTGTDPERHRSKWLFHLAGGQYAWDVAVGTGSLRGTARRLDARQLTDLVGARAGERAIGRWTGRWLGSILESLVQCQKTVGP